MKPLPAWFRYASWFMAALFGLCVALQYNDPDPLRWILIYGAGMAISIALPTKREVASVALVAGCAALVWAIVLVMHVWGVIELGDLVKKMSEKGGAVEEGREAGGLLIQAVWLIVAGVFRRTRA